jgi:hypothetical protein
MTNEIMFTVGIMFSVFIFMMVSIGNEYGKEKAKQ